MEAPSTAQSLAGALWLGEQGVAGWAAASAGASLPSPHHLNVTSQQPEAGGSPHASTWGAAPVEHLHGPHHSAASKIYVQVRRELRVGRGRHASAGAGLPGFFVAAVPAGRANCIPGCLPQHLSGVLHAGSAHGDIRHRPVGA